MGPGDLQDVLGHLATQPHPDLLVGLEHSDDAAVYRLNARQAVIQTVDFFPPIVDDPYQYGMVAAANAMSDVYAMGGRVLLALNVAGFPRDFPRQAIAQIFQGGADKVAEAGGVLAGGHTVVDPEPKYGLSVTGLVDPDRIMIKGGLRAGDRLYLTKPLGTGVVATAGKRDRARAADVDAALVSMLRLNRGAAEACVDLGVAGCTDVTGFGLLGHASEMVVGSGAGVRIRAAAVPVLPGAMDYARGGLFAGGLARNRTHLETLSEAGKAALRCDAGVPKELFDLCCDSETSGGLLFSAPARAAAQERFAQAGEPIWEIGEVIAEPAIVVE